jgi:hypothetical protein
MGGGAACAAAALTVVLPARAGCHPKDAGLTIMAETIADQIKKDMASAGE